MPAPSQSTASPSQTKLDEVVKFTNSHEYQVLEPVQKSEYRRNDAFGYGYAWGRLDQGHPPIVSVIKGEAPGTTDTAWVFGNLYAKMLLELHDPTHPRSTGFSIQGAWDIFAETGCPDGELPRRLS